MASRLQQVEANLRKLVRENKPVRVLAGVLGVPPGPATRWRAEALARALRTRMAWRPERHDLTAGRSEMLRRPDAQVWSGGDCDDRVAAAGMLWRHLTGKDPVGSLYLPNKRRPRHVVLVVLVEGNQLATIDGTPGAAWKNEITEENVMPWPN